MEQTGKRLFVRENGKLYFSKKTERKIFFILTLFMLCFGILYKLGLW